MNEEGNEVMDVKKGAFYSSLRRTNREIKEDRAEAIAEDAELLYKREVEDLQTKIKRIRRDREAMLDLSGNTTTGIISVSDFNAEAFVKKDIELGLKMRELEITLEVAQRGYNERFGVIA